MSNAESFMLLTLTEEQREEIAEIVGCYTCDDEEMFLRIEQTLTNHISNTDLLDKLPKAAETRDIFADISRYATEGRIKMLSKKIDELYDDEKRGDKRMRWARIHYELLFSKKLSTDDLDELSKNAGQLSEIYAKEKTPHRTDQIRNARDFMIYDLVDIFYEYVKGKYQDNWSIKMTGMDAEDLDDCEQFITQLLQYAEIPVPGIGHAQRGEQYQGRLRQLIKKHLST